jgi:hypothetical protein
LTQCSIRVLLDEPRVSEIGIMTVCIAAVCDNGTKLVVAADRMFTAAPPVNVEFETTEKKIETLSASCVALFAGNSSYAFEVLQQTSESLAGSQRPSIAHVTEIARSAYVSVRASKVRETVLIPHLGPDFLRAESLGMLLPAYLQTQGGLYGQMVGVMNQFNLGAEIIVAGVGESGVARIAVIGHPGTAVWLDKLGYAAIGSGGSHATIRLALGAQTRNSPLLDTVYRVYEAKKASEVAPGVGIETDMAIVTAGGASHASIELIATLGAAFKEAQGRTPESLQAVSDAMGVVR